MKHSITIILFLFLSISAGATRRALIIGIGDYPQETGWKKINGDKDIPLVEETLTANGFQTANIVTLCNRQATYSAIKKELESIISKSQQGDYIYIHFSGHGQQITDLNGDEEDGFDEAWITYDAQYAYAKGKYEGQNHLVDDQLNQYLHRLREKIGANGKIIVIADACHSGGGSRAEEEEDCVVRGTADAFIIPNSQISKSNINYPVQWIFVSACNSNQNNYEYNGNGSLTYILHSSLHELNKKTLSQLNDIIRKFYKDPYKFRRTQTPLFEYPIGAENDIFL